MASKEQTIALAGIFQALTIVQSIAHRGMFGLTDYEVCINSILNTDAQDTMAVYGANPGALKIGLKSLFNHFGSNGKTQHSIDLTRYLIGIMVLEKKLAASDEALDRLTKGIKRVNQQVEHFPVGHENIASSLANLYQQTISDLGPKIMINGEHDHLHNKNHAARIRALLLAAVRSAVLWRQKGGTRWKIIFERAKIRKIASELQA